MAVYPSLHRWGGLSLSGHSPEHSDLSPTGKTSNSGMGYTLRVWMPYTQGNSEIPLDQALNRFFFQGGGGVPAAKEQFIAPSMERIIVRPVSSWAEFTRLRHNTASAAVGCDSPVPGLSSRAVGATLNKHTSLGLANFQQASLKRNPIYPCLPL